MTAVATLGARARPTWPFPSSLGSVLSQDPPGVRLQPSSALARRSASEVASWFDDSFLAPLVYDADLLDALAAHLLPQTRAALRQAPNPLHLSAVYREREGGRRYALHLVGYDGPKLMVGRSHTRWPQRMLLPAIPRAVRAAFHPPAGQCYLLADIDRCFPVLLATLAQDRPMLAATRGDLHQQAGDTMAPALPPQQRRRLGKRFNCAVVGLVSPSGWHAELLNLDLPVTGDEARRMHHRWWDRFSDARRWRDAWVDLHRTAATRRLPLAITYPDGRRYTFDAATVRGRARRPGWARLTDPALRLAASIRTTFSALWRGIEGVVLDEALARVYALRERGVRLVVPMYDGLLLQVPAADALALAELVQAAFHSALARVGVPARVTISVAPTWSGAAPAAASWRWSM